MAEPLLLIASMGLCFIAGLVGGFFLGHREAKGSKLLAKHMRRLHKLEMKNG